MLVYLLITISSYATTTFVNALNIPLPGGGRIKFDDGGVIRIQLDNKKIKQEEKILF